MAFGTRAKARYATHSTHCIPGTTVYPFSWKRQAGAVSPGLGAKADGQMEVGQGRKGLTKVRISPRLPSGNLT